MRRFRNGLAWYDTDKRCGEQTGALICHLACEPIDVCVSCWTMIVRALRLPHIYVAQAVRPAKAGANMTQTFLMSTGKLR